MGNVFDSSCGENQNTNLMFRNFFSENPAVYNNAEKYGRAR